jgi:hypothetical protein
MKKEMNNRSSQNKEMNQDDIMNRVNKTFDKISQDVKDMIHKNNDQLS